MTSENFIRLLLRLLIVPLGFFAGTVAGTLVILVASWRLLDMAFGGSPDGPAYAVMGFIIGGPILLLFVQVMLFLPASIGILISEALAIRSWIFHVLNGVVSAWLGWALYGRVTSDGTPPMDHPLLVITAGIAGGLAYWAVAGFNAGFYKPVFRREPPPTVPATTR